LIARSDAVAVVTLLCLSALLSFSLT